MRRSASTQAVSRKVEGIEPRNTRTRKDYAFKPAEVNISTTGKARGCWHSSGSETMACVTLGLNGNPSHKVNKVTSHKVNTSHKVTSHKVNKVNKVTSQRGQA
jgi:hypothetical protein